MKSFAENRPYIENEFEQAHFDAATGLSAQQLKEELDRIQATDTDRPRELVCADAYAYLLDNVQIEINEHTPFAFKFNIGIDYSYFASIDIFQKALFIPQREKVLSEKFPNEYRLMCDRAACGTDFVYTDFWHTVPNWPYVLEHGIAGILEQANMSKARLLRGEHTEGQIVFLDSVIIRYEAMLRLMKRAYDYSLNFNVPEFSACMKHLLTDKPETLYQVMQTAVLFLYFEEIGCERGRTLGPIDQLYLPYYRRDLANGVLMEEIRELIRYFFIHFTATKRFAQQPFAIGGGDKDGNDRCNELTSLLLDVYDEMNIYDPKIHVRYHQNMDPVVFEKVVSMIRNGHSSICVLNDRVVFAEYEKHGIPVEDAQHYTLLGCYEPVIMGMEEAEIAVSWINMVKSVELTLNGGRDILTDQCIGLPTGTDFARFDDLFDVFLQQLDNWVDFAIKFAEMQAPYNTEMNPSPIYSSTFPECLEQGRDVHTYPLKYNNMSLKCFGLATTVDSLAALKKFVFDTKTLTLDEMCDAVKTNWVGREDLRLRIERDADKYGNNRSMPDEIMRRITTHLSEKYCGRRLARGGVLRMGFDSINHCVFNGKDTAATPNGRLATTAVSKNLCATEGADKGGITAYMQSVLKIDATEFLDSVILDFVMHPSAVQGEKGLEDFQSLLKAFFALGGFAAQGNILNGEKLKEAKLHPEKYSTLQVRVCGWNEYFVNLNEDIQDMFIRQCEEML